MSGEHTLELRFTGAGMKPGLIRPKEITVLYGEIMRAGGREPRIQFHTIDGQTVYCKGSRELVQEAGRFLYKEVALRGAVAWNSDTYKIEAFTVESIEPYRKTPPTEALAALREAVAGAFDDIEDVDAFVQQIRVGA